MRPKTPADLDKARQAASWIEDDDVRDLEPRSWLGAALLGFFTWGGGRLYLKDIKAGLALVVALLGWVALSSMLPGGVISAVYALVGGAAALWSADGALRINRLTAVRNELLLRNGPDPAGYRLLAAAATVNPTLAPALPALPSAAAPATDPRWAPLVERLRKLGALRRAGVIAEPELRDRLIDLLSEAAPPTRAEADELLFALLPLADEGVLGPDDFEFVKQLGGSQ